MSDSSTIDCTLSALMQTLYQLMLTPHRYSTTIEDEVARNVFSTTMATMWNEKYGNIYLSG